MGVVETLTECSIQELHLVITLTQQIEGFQLRVLSKNEFYGLMIEESTDISITKQLVWYGLYILKWVEHAVLFYVLLISLGTAECIEEAI